MRLSDRNGSPWKIMSTIFMTAMVATSLSVLILIYWSRGSIENDSNTVSIRPFVLLHFFLCTFVLLCKHAMLPAACEMSRIGHTSVSTRRWFQTNNVRVMDWLPQSPDMNPIENLWGDLKIAAQRHQPTSKAQLKAVLQDEWQRIAPEK